MSLTEAIQSIGNETYEAWYKGELDAEFTRTNDVTITRNPNRTWEPYLYPVTVDLPSDGMYQIKLVRKTNHIAWPAGRDYPVLKLTKIITQKEGSLGIDLFNYMPGFNVLTNSIYYGSLIPNDPQHPDGSGVTSASPGIEADTSTSVDILGVTLSANAMYGHNLSTTSATCRVYVKKSATDPHADAYSDTRYLDITVSGASKSEVTTFAELPLTRWYGADAAGKYTIKVVRLTPSDPNDLQLENRIYLKYLTETVNDTLIFPYTVLTGHRIEANENISGSLPNITCVIDGRTVAVPYGYDGKERTMPDWDAWNGKLSTDPSNPGGATEVWTDNPVWCLLDLLSNPRYGLADKFKISSSKMGLVLANFYNMARYCDERLLEDGTVITDPLDPDWGTAVPRFSLNLVVDEAKSATEWVNVICAAMRATWFYNEGCFLLDVARPRPVSAIFNMSNISNFTESGGSLKQVPNSYEVQYFTSENNAYEQKLIMVESARLQEDLSVEEQKKTLNVRGVTDENRARRLAKYALAVGERLTNTVTFKTGTQGLNCTAGDVIGVQHDVPQWGYGGLIKAAVLAEGVWSITLDEPVDITGASALMISHKGGVPFRVELLGEVNGSTSTIQVANSDLDTAGVIPGIAVDDTFILGSVSNTVKPYRVVLIKPDSDDLVEITAVAYDDELFTYADDLTNLAKPGKTIGYSELELPDKTSVTGFKAASRVYQDTAGNYKIGVDISYDLPAANYWAGVIVRYGVNGVYKTLPQDNTGSIFVPEITVDGNYMFIACSVFKDGTSQTVADALDDYTAVPFQTLHIDQYIPNTLFQAGVTDLQVQGGGTTFTGRDCTITWSVPVVIDALAGTTPSIGDGANNSWLKEYKVEVLNSANNALRRTEYVVLPSYTYTHEMNHQDGVATRALKFRVTAYDRLGRASNPVSVSVSNAAPAKLT